MDDYTHSPLYKNAFVRQGDCFDMQRNFLETAYSEFRRRVSLLVAQIHKDMPSLTVHDISHIDALWWTASEVAGSDYPLNPAEAFVLGGAFLLHDAAHCIAAYPGGVAEVTTLPEWRHFAAMAGLDYSALTAGSEQFQIVLFEVLRAMHPKQARRLAKLHWSVPGDSEQLYLLPNDELRRAYGDAIGQIAESHWSAPHELETLARNRVNPPACIHPAPWSVDILKVAVLLRTADAAHMDAQRAPRFLIALVHPGGSSLVHWQFQSRIHEVKRDPDPLRKDLCISGSAFPPEEQDAWWMAYDTARMIDKELRAANRILLEHHRSPLAAQSVAFAYSPEVFARNVPTEGWQPVDTSIKITDIKSMVERFGGEKLYGQDPAAAVREILQNAVDAIHACRSIGGLGAEEGEIEVSLDEVSDGYWLNVSDTGIGMSRYVLTEVLLDFGKSLWRSSDLRGEWGDLPVGGFEAIGQFGIGFFSIFMLGQRVRVVTKRFEPKEGECPQWLLEFTAGTDKRPILRTPNAAEKLKRHGTRLSVLISREKLLALCPKKIAWSSDSPHLSFSQACARLAPALDINLYVREPNGSREQIVKANDWLTLSPTDFLKRVGPAVYEKADSEKFGNWSHLSEFRDGTGKTVGRCAVQSQSRYPFYRADVGIGVVKGLFAGIVPGLAGVVFCEPQSDLARQTAIPDVSLSEIQRWAEEQKKSLLAHRAISDEDSALLARLGASHNCLTLGELGGQSVSREELIEFIRDAGSLIVHDGEVRHDDDDDVLRRDFESHFEPATFLLEVPTRGAPNWLEQIPDSSICRDSWSLEAALESAVQDAWGEVDWERRDEVIGSVNGINIVRECRVATQKIDINVSDL